MRLVKRLILLVAVVLSSLSAYGQFHDSGSGLLQAPSADMNQDGTFMITNNFLNKHSISERGWGYHTFGYGVNVNLWSRLEIGYVLTIFDGKRRPNPSARDLIMFNQDRHFTAKVLLLREGEFGWTWMPALAVGVSDPATGQNTGEYIGSDVSGEIVNGYFNRSYIVATKHLATGFGAVGIHLGYQYSPRKEMPMNGPCAAIDWVPKWLETRAVSVKAIAEYNAYSFNIGLIASFWDDRIEAMFDLMSCKWINFGVRYKLRLK